MEQDKIKQELDDTFKELNQLKKDCQLEIDKYRQINADFQITLQELRNLMEELKGGV